MISIKRATDQDYKSIVSIGNIAVGEAHRESCSAKDMSEYLQVHYNDTAIREELDDANNIYHIIYFNSIPVGFSKIILHAGHPAIQQDNVTKLDRIYLLQQYQGHTLGFQLLNFNIKLSKENNQVGMWLYTWVGNKKAIGFYLKMGFTIIGEHQFKVSETCYNPNHHMFLTY